MYHLMLKSRVPRNPLRRQTGRSAYVYVGYRATQNPLGTLLRVLLAVLSAALPLGRNEFQALKRPSQRLRGGRRPLQEIAVVAAMRFRWTGGIGQG